MPYRFKLLVLDYGGVYSFHHADHAFNTIMKSTFDREPNEEGRREISEQSRLLGANKITTQEYIAVLGEIFSTPQLPTVQQFEDATIAATHPPSPEMVELVATVRSSGIKVSLLSDMYLFEAELTRPWGHYEGFDYVSLSAETGLTKHDPGFFENTLNHFGVAAHKAVFVDDTIKNSEVAKTVGLATLVANKEKYTHASELATAIRQLLGV